MSEIVAYEKGSNYAELIDIVSVYPEKDGVWNQDLNTITHNHKGLVLESDLARYIPENYKYELPDALTRKIMKKR